MISFLNFFLQFFNFFFLGLSHVTYQIIGPHQKQTQTSYAKKTANYQPHSAWLLADAPLPQYLSLRKPLLNSPQQQQQPTSQLSASKNFPKLPQTQRTLPTALQQQQLAAKPIAPTTRTAATIVVSFPPTCRVPRRPLPPPQSLFRPQATW